MYNDGIIGNLGLLQVLGINTAGQFNTVLPQGKIPFKLQDIIPTQYDYLYPPLTDEQKAKSISDNLVAFAKINPNAPSHLFKEK
jgi:hypothetical protein